MKSGFRAFAFAVLPGFLGFTLYSPSRTPDIDFAWSSVLGSFLIFLFWAIGCLGWGRFWSSLLKWPDHSRASQTAGWIALGSVWGSASIYMMAVTLGMGAQLKPLGIFWVLIGIAFLTFLRQHQISSAAIVEAPETQSEKWLFRFLALMIGLTFIARVIQSAQIHSHGDPYICYLTGPRHWFDNGTLGSLRENYTFFYAASWEALYQWGNLLLAKGPGSALDSTQRFAQWITSFMAYGGLLVTVYALTFDPGRKFGRALALMAALAATSVPVLRGYGNLAKNDLGASFWLIAALLPLFQDPKISPMRSFLSTGLLMGAGLMAKIPYVIFVAGQGAAWIIRYLRRGFRGMARPAAFILLGMLCGVSWIALRNIYYTGNPFFPFLQNVFGTTVPISYIHQQSLSGIDAAQVHLNARSLRLYFGELLSSWWPLPLSLLGFALPLRLFSKTQPLLFFTLGGWISAVLFTFKFRQVTEIRYQGPTLILLAASGIVALSGLILKSRKPLLVSAMHWVAGIALVLTSDLPLFTFLQLNPQRFPPTPLATLGLTGGKAKQWIRTHSNRENRTIALGDNEIYYGAYLGLVEYSYDAALVEKLGQIGQIDQALSYLVQTRRRYLYDWRPYNTYATGVIPEILKFSERCKGCTPYEDAESRVIDLECLKSRLEHASEHSECRS